MKQRAGDIFLSKPDVLKRLGEDIFIKTPLYKSKKRHRPVYINRKIFNQLFELEEDISWDEMSDIIEFYFSTTIEKDNGTGEKVGDAYVDKQADPLDLSLSGNLGSGRAYYAGKYFNIKGEKTPLATSNKRQYSDGLLEMERSLWEALIANSLQDSITTGLSGVLAILDMGEDCDVEWRDKLVKRGKIIRVDMDGELDRATHVFYNKTPLSKGQLELCAKKYGQLEADKFIERITHGTWSAGNISVKGHLIDFDTVCAVKGRGALYSSTRWHHENRFGFEYYGQLKILESLAQDHDINIDGVSFKALEKELLSSMKDQMERRFLSLMGFKDEDKLYSIYKEPLSALVELFQVLSRKNYKKLDGSSTKEVLSTLVHVFDFSSFFRSYPLFKKSGSFSVAQAISLMCQSELLEDPFEGSEEALSDMAKEYLDKVYDVIEENFVQSEEDLQLLQIAAVNFIKKYDALYQRIIEETGQDLDEIEAQSYIMNEDRFYLFPYFTLSYDIAENDNQRSDQVIDKMTNALVLSNQRALIKKFGGYITDVKLYEQGYSYKLLDKSGMFQVGFSFFDEGLESTFIKEGKVEILIDGEALSMRPLLIEGANTFLSSKIKTIELKDKIHREMSFYANENKICTQGEYVSLLNLIKE